MTNKIGRNDPCPCGSGKKYKQCCGNASTSSIQPDKKGHDGAVPRALDWLMAKHRKAVSTAISEMLFDGLDDEAHEILESQDADTWQGIQINATEWMLAEGSILVKGTRKRVSEYLLGIGGPLFTVEQRQWIEQLAARPLRLYTVTDVISGQQMTLCDALDKDAAPIIVHEKLGSREVTPGMQVGYRIMEIDGHYELSGAAYPFSRLAGSAIVTSMREANDEFAGPRNELPTFLSFLIRRHWLEQFFAPTPMPTVMDTQSNEPILLITDHYRVKDLKALSQKLSAQPDVDGNRKSGWSRLIDCADGQMRPAVTINVEASSDRVSLFYRTQGYADRNRPWFEALANDAVQFMTREITDPKGAFANMPAGAGQKLATSDGAIPPEMAAEVIERAMRRIYANWADEPIEALNGKTPRQAIKTPAGLERVKGLLREYEMSEKNQAELQGRRAISHAFLWKELGISIT